MTSYIHFEITGDPCNLIGSHWSELFTNRTIFLLSHLFPSQRESSTKIQQSIDYLKKPIKLKEKGEKITTLYKLAHLASPKHLYRLKKSCI